jgi:hypothetical protein
MPDRRPRLPSAEVGWIAEGRRPFSDYAVGSLVPAGFEAYARIFHPAWAPSKRKDTPVRWDAVAAWSGHAMHALAQWESLSTPVAGIRPSPPFVAPPDTDGLPPDTLAVLCGLLSARTQTVGDCFIGVWEGYGWPVEMWGREVLDLEERTYVVRRGALGLALEIEWEPVPGQRLPSAPNLLWPADRRWFVASDTDLDSTYLGGSRDLVNALLEDHALEAWAVAASDGITRDSDVVNL